MGVEDVPPVDHFDCDDLVLSPETHHAQAKMAAERGKSYDPYAVEERAEEWVEEAPDPFPE